MASKSHVRVFTADHGHPEQLTEQINAEIGNLESEVTAVSISVGHGVLVAMVAFKKLD